MTEALAQQSDFQPMTAVQIKAQVALIQDVMKSIMQLGQHYGTVPGCGDKKTLLKPGAEKLMMTFRLAADPHIQEIPTEDGITFRVVCRITNQASGVFLGAGIGEASSREDKYNWRSAVCEEEYQATPDDRKRVKWGRRWEKGRQTAYQIKQVRTNWADQANTILKMAKKRALVDAILTVTAASDIFTQGDEGAEDAAGKKTGSAEVKPITEGQAKILFAKARAKSVTEADILEAFGLDSINDIPAPLFSEVLAFIEKGVLVSHEE
ncbi:MAG: hypothetical protein A2052_03720 [Deltaproteobacteria bacterium GWA2_54_12]|nr:MAG: hypothetical protein A2052_03720 [Deltaproteobacteria bacterium GWA2_54_12]